MGRSATRSAWIPASACSAPSTNWYNYSACFPEAEERSPWPPFHVQKGFKADESVASVFFGGCCTLAGFGPRETWQEEFRRVFAACEQHFAPLLVLDPIAARGFVELGFDTKEKLAEWLSDNGRLTAREYWDNQWVQTLFRSLAVAGVEPYAAKYRAQPDERIRLGGETQGAWRMFGGRYMKSIPIDAWR
ncbi:MAG: hypothetical protein ACT4P3_06795 [Betaproteobacteria bacterium]